MKLPPLKEALFLERLNRFVCKVETEEGVKTALIRNTGRLRELLKRGNRVFVREKSTGKHPYEIILAQGKESLVCVESHYANKLYEEFLRKKGINFRREVKIGRSRYDFLLGDSTLVEVKSVNLVRKRVALFPDAPTGRGRRHVVELMELSSLYRPLIVFVVQREDCEYFSPNCEEDPAFCEALREYARRGFKLQAFRCRVSLKEITIEEEVDVRIEG